MNGLRARLAEALVEQVERLLVVVARAVVPEGVQVHRVAADVEAGLIAEARTELWLAPFAEGGPAVDDARQDDWHAGRLKSGGEVGHAELGRREPGDALVP